MKIAFLASDKAREQHLADAFLMGARRHGHQTEVRDLTPGAPIDGYDVACLVGVKSRELFQAHRAAGITTIYLDKGYSRHKRIDGAGWEFWRVSINTHHPTRRLEGRKLSHDRLALLDVELKPWRKRGVRNIFAGSSAKYHAFYGLREPTGYAERITAEMRSLDARRVIYRPKPSWADAQPVTNCGFSRPPETLDELLKGAWCMVTHGSNACFEAIVSGVPVIVLGDAVAKPISSIHLRQLADPPLASDKERKQWLANLAWFQWTQAEMCSGAAWDFIGEELHG